MSKTTIMFGVHNKRLKVYAIIGKERKNKAILGSYNGSRRMAFTLSVLLCKYRVAVT